MCSVYFLYYSAVSDLQVGFFYSTVRTRSTVELKDLKETVSRDGFGFDDMHGLDLNRGRAIFLFIYVLQ